MLAEICTQQIQSGMRTLFFSALITILNLQLMATDIHTEITIQASPEQVWQVLTQFEKYPEYNIFIKQIEGNLVVGDKLKVTFDGMTFKPKVLVCNPNKELRWIGRLGFKGVFDGEHRFVIKDNGDGSCTLEQSEHFSGVLVPFLKKLLTETEQNFKAMNEVLKREAELLSAQ